MSKSYKKPSEMTLEEVQAASNRLFNLESLEQALISRGVTTDAIAELAARYLKWLFSETEDAKGRTAFVAKDIMKLVEFVQSTALQKAKLGIDEKAYKAIISHGNKRILDMTEKYRKATNSE